MMIWYSHIEEGPKVDSSRRQIEDVHECTKDKDYKKKIQKMVKQKTNRICSRMYERQRLQEEDPKDDSIKDKQKMSKNIYKRRRLQEEDPQDDLVKDKQKMSKNIQKMKITEDVPAKIDDEDDR